MSTLAEPVAKLNAAIDASRVHNSKARMRREFEFWSNSAPACSSSMQVPIVSETVTTTQLVVGGRCLLNLRFRVGLGCVGLNQRLLGSGL